MEALEFRVRSADRVNLASATVYVPEIHLVLNFDGRVDRPRLARALRLLLDAEPVLGCRFAAHWLKPRWVRLPPEVLDSAVLVEEAAPDDPDPEGVFYNLRVNGAAGPQIKALLIPLPEGDRVVLKINHATCDAGGFKALAGQLAEIYQRLASEREYRPPMNLGDRSLGQVYRRLGIARLLAVYFRGLRETLRFIFPFRSFQPPSGKDAAGPMVFVFRHFSRERVRGLLEYARSRGATVNDLFVAALFRAMARQYGWRGKGALRMVGTVDLRRYLPERLAGALCQVTGMSAVHLGKTLGQGFDDTLAAVKARMDEQKARYLGLGLMLHMAIFCRLTPWFLFRRMLGNTWQLGLADGNLPPGFTNLGPLDEGALSFGAPKLTGAWLCIPATLPPWLGAGLSGFAGTLTLSAGVCASARDPKELETLFENMDAELPRGAVD